MKKISIFIFLLSISSFDAIAKRGTASAFSERTVGNVVAVERSFTPDLEMLVKNCVRPSQRYIRCDQNFLPEDKYGEWAGSDDDVTVDEVTFSVTDRGISAQIKGTTDDIETGKQMVAAAFRKGNLGAKTFSIVVHTVK